MARKPRVKKPAKERPAKTRRRAPSAFAIVVFLLVAGTAGLGAWLTFTHHSVEAPEPGAGVSRAVMQIDLSKEGHGEQAPPQMAGVAKKTEDAHHSDNDSDGHGKAAKKDDAKSESGHDKKAAKKAPPSPEPSVEPTVEPTVETTVEPTADNDAHKTTDKHEDEHGDKHGSKPAPIPQVSQAAKPAGPKGSFTRSGGLRPAPDPALVKKGQDGPLPVVASDGRTPLQVYARPYKATGRPRIAIVVGGLGMSQATTLAAIQQLPGGVTLAFAPYGRTLQDYVNQARAAGHEVLLQVPMEPMDYPTNDPGPHTLLTSLTINRNLKRLEWLFGRFTGYVGVVNQMGGRFTSAQTHLTPILAAMQSRGLMFLDAKASSSSVAVDIAGQIGLYVAASDRVVDITASRAAIDARLLELERLASASGGAIGIGYPYPVTIERLAQWTRAMGDRGYDLVPVSALTSHNEAVR